MAKLSDDDRDLIERLKERKKSHEADRDAAQSRIDDIDAFIARMTGKDEEAPPAPKRKRRTKAEMMLAANEGPRHINDLMREAAGESEANQ